MTVMQRIYMNPKIKEAWLEALRGQDYIQGRGCLKTLNPTTKPEAPLEPVDEERHCCLGVLTDLYMKECGGEWKAEGREPDDSGMDYCYLPEPVAIWAGLYEIGSYSYYHSTKQDNGYDIKMLFKDPEEPDNLPVTRNITELNDDHCNFEEIADLIEAQL